MVSPPPSNGEVTPVSIMQLGMSFMPARALTAAVQLHVFSHIAANHHTVDAIAQAAGASERGMGMLLDVLTSLQLLEKKAGGYHLTPAAAQYLVQDSPDYLGAVLEDDSLWQGWGHLADAIRTGKPPRQVERQPEAERFFPILIRSLHVLNREPAQLAAQTLGAGNRRQGLHVLDVACGSGIWGIAVAEADPQATLTLQDYPAVLEHTRGYVQRHDLTSRCDYLPGDLKKVDFGEQRYDLALLGNIVHSEGESSSRDLFRRLHRALKTGGQIAIVEVIPHEDRTGPVYPLTFALNMLVNTELGSTYTVGELTAWLKDAGFTQVTTADINSHSPLVIGQKGY